MRKVFLDDLPRKEGYDGNKIDWKASVGFKIRFIYKDIEGEMEIVEWGKNDIILIKYKNKTFSIKTYDLSKCSIGRIVGKKTRSFKVEIGARFKDSNRDLTILDREYRDRMDCKGNNKWYRYICERCGWDNGWMVEANLIGKKQGCACCRGHIVISGINDLYTTDYWMVELGVEEKWAKTHTKSCSGMAPCICPHCGKHRTRTANRIYAERSISCPSCGDGISYPEKMFMSVLSQLNIKYMYQLSSRTYKWVGSYRYDFYLSDIDEIYEIHGGQHYKQALGAWGKLEDVKNNDINKKKVAVENGYKNKYNIINCKKSNLEWVKLNILKSNLSKKYDLSKVDWEECEVFSLTDISKQVCDYWNLNKDNKNIQDIANKFHISKDTVKNYLKKWSEIGRCDYDVAIEIDKRNKKFIEANKKRCSRATEIFKDGISLGIFESTCELERQSEKLFGVRLDHSKIGMVANNQRNHHKGYTFKYIG